MALGRQETPAAQERRKALAALNRRETPTALEMRKALIALDRRGTLKAWCVVLALVVLDRGHAQEAWCGELPPVDWCVKVAQDGPDREGVLESLRAGLAQDVQG